MATPTKESLAGTSKPTVTPIQAPKNDDLILVYETYYKSFEWKFRSQVDTLKGNGETILTFPTSRHSSTVWITVPWCLQNTYDDEDNDDGYNDGGCEGEDLEGEEIEVPGSVFENKDFSREDMKVVYVQKGH